MPPVIQIFIAVVIISAIVGAIAQFMSKLNEQQANANKLAAARRPRPDGGAVRQSANDVDRFLAEIDRLRHRGPDGASGRSEPVPVARPTGGKKPLRVRPVAEPSGQAPPRRVLRAEPAFMAPLALIPSPSAPLPRREELPVATVLTPPAEPTTVVTTLPASRRAPETPQTPFTPFTPQAVPTRRSVPTPKTDFARSLVGLLGSKEGVPMAIVLTEIFGPPKARTMTGGEREGR